MSPQHFGVSGVEAQESKNSNVNRENVLLGKNFLILITMSEKRKTQNAKHKMIDLTLFTFERLFDEKSHICVRH